MPERNNHPSAEEIMEFVSMSKESVDCNAYAKYFSLITHFVHCEKCRRTKEEMIAFLDRIESSFSQNKESRALKLKIYRSLEALNASEEWQNHAILWTVKGRVSKEKGKSVIQKIKMDYDYAEKMQIDDETLGYNEIMDSNHNRIILGQEKIEVSLADDGREKHSVLVIPEKEGHTPMLCAMQKNKDTWQMNCDCPEDEYDIVIF